MITAPCHPIKKPPLSLYGETWVWHNNLYVPSWWIEERCATQKCLTLLENLVRRLNNCHSATITVSPAEAFVLLIEGEIDIIEIGPSWSTFVMSPVLGAAHVN